MIHPDTLSVMARQKRLQIQDELKQVRLAEGYDKPQQGRVSISGKVRGFVQSLAAPAPPPSAGTTE